MGVVKVQGHAVSPTSNWFTSLFPHINQRNNSWDSASSKFELEKSIVKVMGEAKDQGQIVDPASNWCISFSFHINRTNHSRDMYKRVACFTLKKNS